MSIFTNYFKRSKLRQENPIAGFFINAWLIFFAVASIIPMAWLLVTPSKNDGDVTNRHALAFGNFNGYKKAWDNLQFFDEGVIFRWLLNSIWYTASIVIIATVTATLAGFVLSTSSIKFKKSILISTLITMLVPPMALVVPVFVLVDKLSLMDNPVAVIFVSSLYPFGVFLAYVYFTTTVPRELYEAGRSDFKLFTKIALPLSWPLVSLLAFFAFIGNWANYFLPYILLPSGENYTLPIGLGFLFSATPAINPAVGATSVPIYKPEIALAGVLIALPIMIVFMISQKRLGRGMLSGSIKE